MSSVPAPSRRVLAELAATFLVDAGTTERRASSVRRIFVELTKLLDAWNAALAKIDQIAAELVARHGYPCVALLVRPGSPPAYAADPGTIRRRLGTEWEARRLTANLPAGRAASCRLPRR